MVAKSALSPKSKWSRESLPWQVAKRRRTGDPLFDLRGKKMTMHRSKLNFLLLLTIPMFMAACSSSGKILVTQPPTETVDHKKTVALSVEPGVEQPEAVHIDVANRVRAALFGRLVSDRIFKAVVHKPDPADYTMDIVLQGAREVSTGARIMLGAMAGSNNLHLDVTLRKPNNQVISAFSVEGNSASHPWSSQSSVDDAIREAVEQIIEALR